MSKELNIAILKCDDVLPKFVGKFSNYTDMIIASFTSVCPSAKFTIFDAQKSEFPKISVNASTPKARSEFDLFVTTGSKASIYDEDQWILDLVAFVKLLYQHDLKLFGICFGHQAIAKAMNCSVIKSEKGWGVGVASNKILNADFFPSNKRNLDLLVSHQDQVVELTDQARIIASSAFCPNFLVEWQAGVLSVQGHPEWQKAYSKALMNDRRDRIPHDVIEEGIQSLDKELDNYAFMMMLVNYFGLN